MEGLIITYPSLKPLVSVESTKVENESSKFLPASTVDIKDSWSKVDQSEEDYFDADDEEALVETVAEDLKDNDNPPPLKKLVDYEEDDGFQFDISSPTKKLKV